MQRAQSGGCPHPDREASVHRLVGAGHWPPGCRPSGGSRRIAGRHAGTRLVADVPAPFLYAQATPSVPRCSCHVRPTARVGAEPPAHPPGSVRPRRRPGPHRAAHLHYPRTTRQQRTTPTSTTTRRLALGGGRRPSARQNPRHPAALLTTGPTPTTRTLGEAGRPAHPARPGPPRGRPRPTSPHSKHADRSSRGSGPKKGLFDQMTSENGGQFSKAGATFAIKHVDADYKAEAVEAAESYLEALPMSRAALVSLPSPASRRPPTRTGCPRRGRNPGGARPGGAVVRGAGSDRRSRPPPPAVR